MILLSISETEAACRRRRDISVNSYLNSIISRVPYLRLGPSTGLSYTLTRMKLKNMPKALSGKTLKQKTQAESEPEVQTSRFMVQEHHARRLHWDFRLEMDGVLKSWAVPKGVPTELRVKRLAVQVDDHPLSYFDFEGNIPEGQYGAGTVKVWDKGLYVLTLREPRKLHILLKGRKLEGLPPHKFQSPELAPLPSGMKEACACLLLGTAVKMLPRPRRKPRLSLHALSS